MTAHLNPIGTASLGSSDEQGSWAQVHEAVIRRWPHIRREELSTSEQNITALATLLASRTNATREEIEAVLREHAPHASGSSEQMLSTVKESAQQFYTRAEETMSEAPMKTATVAFLTGLATGILLTTLYVASQPEPTMWQSVRSHRWL